MVSAISSVRASSPSAMRREVLGPLLLGGVAPRREGGLGGGDGRSTSAAVPSGMVAMTSSVVALITLDGPVPVDGTQAPLM